MSNPIKKWLAEWRKVIKLSMHRTGVCLHAIDADQQANIHSLTFDEFRKLIHRINRVARILPVEEYLEEAAKGTKRITTITFDDAYKNIAREAVPFMVEQQLPVTIFVNASTLSGEILWRDRIRMVYDLGKDHELLTFLKTQGIDLKDNLYRNSKQPEVNSAALDKLLKVFAREQNLKMPQNLYLSGEELKSLDAHQEVSFGNHTSKHYMLSSLTKAEQEIEIKTGHEALSVLNIKLAPVFAAPFGSYQSINSDTFKIIEDMGYKGVLLTNGLSVVDKSRLPESFNLKVANRYLP